MDDPLKTLGMTVACLPVLAVGFGAALNAATSFVGFLTAITGLIMGICGCIWWFRKLRK